MSRATFKTFTPNRKGFHHTPNFMVEREVVEVGLTRQMMEAIHTKLNKTSISKAWEAPKCYQRILQKAKLFRVTTNR